MKTIIYILSVSLILLSVNLQGQQPKKGTVPSMVDKSRNYEHSGIHLLENTGGGQSSRVERGWVSGAYFNPEWQDGLILMKDGSSVRGNQYRYNLYTQQMEFISGSDTLAIANPEEIDLIRIADRVFVYGSFVCDARQKSGYFELLEDGPCRLLKRWVTSFHQSDGTATAADCDNDLFRKECNCFLQFGNSPAELMRLKRKDFVELFGGDAERISRFIRKNKLKIKDEEDLRHIIAFYNHVTAIE